MALVLVPPHDFIEAFMELFDDHNFVQELVACFEIHYKSIDGEKGRCDRRQRVTTTFSIQL